MLPCGINWTRTAAKKRSRRDKLVAILARAFLRTTRGGSRHGAALRFHPGPRKNVCCFFPSKMKTLFSVNNKAVFLQHTTIIIKRGLKHGHATAPPPPLVRLAPPPAATAGDAGDDWVPPALPAVAEALPANMPVKFDIHATVCACLASFRSCRSCKKKKGVVEGGNTKTTR